MEAVSEGNTKITAAITVGNTEYTAVCAVSVISPPKAEISLDQTSVAMDAGTEITLGAVVVDPEGNPISDAIIEWNSSDERVVSVENGIVRGIEGGAAVVTASVVVEDDKYIANCDVTVSNKYTVNVFRPKEEEHALTYLFSDGKTTLSELAENFEIDVERNGVKLTDYHKQDVAPIEKENERDENYEAANPQIDSERTRNNYRFTPYFGKTYTEFINGRIKELGLSPRKDAVVMNSFVLGSDKTFFDGLSRVRTV